MGENGGQQGVKKSNEETINQTYRTFFYSIL